MNDKVITNILLGILGILLAVAAYLGVLLKILVTGFLILLLSFYLFIRFSKDKQVLEFKEKWIGTIDSILWICLGLLGVWKLYNIFQNNWISGLIILVVLTMLTMLLLFIIPTAHYGVHTRLGKRTGRKSKEGPTWRIPYLEDWKVIPAGLGTYELAGKNAAVVFTKDNRQVTIECSAKGRPSFDRLLVFLEISEETITSGMQDAIEQELGIIAGELEGEDFVTQKDAIRQIINCIFLLERRPDFFVPKNNPKSFIYNSPDSFTEYLANLRRVYSGKKELPKIDNLESSKWEIPTDSDDRLAVLDFYVKNVTRVELMLKLEKSVSRIEQLYCLDLETMEIAKTTYTEATVKAMEEKQQAQGKIRASLELHATKMKLMDEYMNLRGMSAEHASDAIDTLLGLAKKQVISGQGNTFNVLQN